MSVDRALSRLLFVRGQSIVDDTVCLWTEQCRCYCLSVDRALSKLHCALSRLHSVRGKSFVEATVYPWTQPCQGYCVSVDGAFLRLRCVRVHSIVKATVNPTNP